MIGLLNYFIETAFNAFTHIITLLNHHIGIYFFLKSSQYVYSFLFLGQTEVNFLGQLRHPNLVKLIGYCCEDDHRLLVYEFMFRGSLENHLFRSNTSTTLRISNVIIAEFLCVICLHIFLPIPSL